MAAVTYLCYAVLFTTSCCLFLVTRYFIVKIIDKRSICIITTDPRTIFPLFFLLYQIDTLFYAGLKIAYQDGQIIGRDTYVTVAGCLIPVLGQVGLVLYFFIVLKFLKSYMTMIPVARRERVEGRFALLIVLCSTMFPLCCIFGFMPVVGLIYPGHLRDFGMIFLVGIGLLAWLYGWLISSALRDVLIELKNHVDSYPQSSGELKVVLRRLTRAYYVLIANCLAVGLFAILFGTIETLRRQTIFMMVLASLNCPIASTLLVLTVAKMPAPKVSPTETALAYGTGKSGHWNLRAIPLNKLNSGNSRSGDSAQSGDSSGSTGIRIQEP